MADVDLKVMEMVEKALAKEPDVGSSDLFDRVKEKHPGVADLSVRQFHARYPLQVKRRKAAAAAAASGAAPARKKSTPKRSRARKQPAAEAAPRPSRTRTRGAAPATNGRTSRDAVRAIILAFATELASADAKADVVKVLAGADQYVDQVISALDS
ncbi:hypothetical protein [Gaopeijia maritima]|uniref:Uncharacterized protein n=1 Tax=Gaopeijia maritima TaxID=3119007 RepID=A0ABU9E5S2_9BACT